MKLPSGRRRDPKCPECGHRAPASPPSVPSSWNAGCSVLTSFSNSPISISKAGFFWTLVELHLLSTSVLTTTNFCYYSKAPISPLLLIWYYKFSGHASRFSDILILNSLPVFPKYASSYQTVCPTFRLKKKRSVCSEESQGMWKYCVLLTLYPVSKRVFLQRLFWRTPFPVPTFFSGSMDANTMWLQKPPQINQWKAPPAAHLTTELLQSTGDIDLVSLYDLGCNESAHVYHIIVTAPPIKLWVCPLGTDKAHGSRTLHLVHYFQWPLLQKNSAKA